MKFFANVFNALSFDFGGSSTLLASKMERFKYRPGRLDLMLLFDPAKQGEFERAWLAARKARVEALMKDKQSYEAKLTELHNRHAEAVREIERQHDRTMRMLVIRFGAVSEQEPLVLREKTMTRALGAAAEA